MSKKIHRITARDEKEAAADEAKRTAEEDQFYSDFKKSDKENKKAEKKAEKAEQKLAKKSKKAKKPMPKWLAVITWPFRMLAKPFIALGRYFHDSWLELRQVRWPSRGATWKMFLAIIIYAGLFMGLIALLDMLFTWLFNLIIG